MAVTLKELESQVKEDTNLEHSAAVLVTGLADLLDGLSQDPLAIKALAADLRTNAAALGTAVCANTQQNESDGIKGSKWPALPLDKSKSEPEADSPPPPKPHGRR